MGSSRLWESCGVTDHGSDLVGKGAGSEVPLWPPEPAEQETTVRLTFLSNKLVKNTPRRFPRAWTHVSVSAAVGVLQRSSTNRTGCVCTEKDLV